MNHETSSSGGNQLGGRVGNICIFAVCAGLLVYDLWEAGILMRSQGAENWILGCSLRRSMLIRERGWTAGVCWSTEDSICDEPERPAQEMSGVKRSNMDLWMELPTRRKKMLFNLSKNICSLLLAVLIIFLSLYETITEIERLLFRQYLHKSRCWQISNNN